MRILIVASSYHPYKGGVETVVGDLVKSLKSQGDQVVVVTNLWPKSLPFFEVFEGSTIIRVPMIVPTQTGHSLVDWLKRLFTYFTTSILVMTFRPQVINVQCVGPNGYLARRLGKAYRLPIVVSTHGERKNDSSGFYESEQNVLMFNNLINDASSVVCVSEVSATESLIGIDYRPSLVKIIPNAITVTGKRMDCSARDIDIVFVGRMVKEKGVDTLVRSVSLLIKSVEDIKVHLIGDGPCRLEITALITDLGLDSQISCLGQLDRDTVDEVLMRSKILVLPSRRESFGLVLLEAANAGCAVVASATGGIPSVVDHGINGFLFEVDSHVQLAGQLKCLLTDSNIRTNLIANFDNRLGAYDITTFIDSYNSVFLEVAHL